MSEPNDALPKGLILLSQPEQLRTAHQEMLDALPEAYRGLPHILVDLDMSEESQQAIRSLDWSAVQHTMEELFRSKLAPLKKQHPDYRIIYFGSSPVPLAIHLGFLINTWQQVEVVPHHHGQRIWKWISEPGKPPARLTPVQLPEERDRTPGEAIIRVSTSHVVDPLMTRRVVSEPLVEIDIALEHPAEDAFSHLQEMQKVAHAFREALDTLGDQFPGVDRIHLFASVQPGVALLLGAQISPTMHPPVQTYQYVRNTESSVYHVPAVLVNGPERPEPVPLGPGEKERAKRDREHLAEDLERMKGFASQPPQHLSQGWLAGLLARPDGHSAFSHAWLHLPALRETPLSRSTVDVPTHSVEDSFRLESTLNVWQLDDHWLTRLSLRLPETKEKQRALRMLVLHELAHRGPQALTSFSSRGIGRFPKVLEEIDYHADVWAMLHEHALTGLQSPREVEDVQRFFMDLIRIATNTMWAFDDGGPPLREIQVRRLNRYLIWAWQYLLLERGAGMGRRTTLDTVLAILAQRPVIELAGPDVRTRSERIYFALDSAHMNVPELAIYHDGRLYRHGARFDFSIKELLAHVQKRESQKILDALRAAFEQTVR
ncbi:SAVED domain-containing protein [Hyalangium gracile]|uniref:SAVED domain-containing protein n=1 Tax=Hyalangium gracile TaxID=394092 RepID=UPI001CCD1EB8|nr:SAVED domain-containing protein [Hyalangium gracile]